MTNEALVAAVKAGDAGRVRELLAEDAGLRGRLDEPLAGIDFDGTVLLEAVWRGDRAMVEALLDGGADVNARSRWWAGGFGVLDAADGELAEYLIGRGARVDAHAAARLGKVDRLRELIAEDARVVHARGGDGQMPLHFAATVEIAAMLLDAGAEVNAKDIDHESTALQYVVSTKGVRGEQRHDVARYLVERGAEADLLAASALGDAGLVEALLDDDPERVYVTVTDRSFPKVDSRAGGTIYLYGFGFTKTPHMVAREFGHDAVYRLLMQRSAPWLRLVQAAETGERAQVEEIAARFPDAVKRLSERASRRLIGVAVRNNLRAVELLVGLGWPAAATMENGQSVLHFAAWHGNVAMVRLLLERGVVFDGIESEHGGTPLAWALDGSLRSWERGSGDYAEVARVLLAAGAKAPAGRPLRGSAEIVTVVEAATASAS